MRSIIFCTCLILLCSGRLLLPKDVQQIFQSAQGTAPTSCKQVDVTKLSPLLPVTQSVYAGYMTVADTNSALGFIFYGSQLAKTPAEISNYPTIIWLNGGPGSSSQTGNFLELGPIRINVDGTQTLNKYSWDTQYNVMFVDQPIGTGFSVYATVNEIPTNQTQVGQHFIHALDQFLTAQAGCVNTFNLKGLLTSPWFLFGESYAGKYVPSIAKAAIEFTKYKIPLRGAGVGDGFTDPMSVLKEMPSFGFNLGLIDYQERQQCEKAALGGVMKLKNKDYLGGSESFGEILETIIESSGEVNEYNIFVFGSYDDMDAQVQTYLNSTATKAVLGFTTNFAMSSNEVYAALSVDFMKSDCIQTVESILETIPVLIYNGQNDLIVPNPATLKWVQNLNYKNSTEFRGTDFSPWNLNNTNTTVGYKKQAGNLELRIVNKAGHLVPMDQPESALDMIRDFVETHKGTKSQNL